MKEFAKFSKFSAIKVERFKMKHTQFNCILFTKHHLMKNYILISILLMLSSCSNLRNLENAKSSPGSITTLNLSNSGLTDVPVEIATMSNLQKLILFRNKLESIPGFVGNLSKLETLSIQSNKLKSLPPEIGKLSNLKKLDLRFNHLKQLPDESCNLSELVELDMRNNLLDSLPFCIGDLSKLEYLYLADNNLLQLSENIKNLKNLRLLNLGRNNIQGKFPTYIGQLESLIELDVSGCCADNNLPDELGNLKRLEILYVSSYQILPYKIGWGNPRLKVIVK